MKMENRAIFVRSENIQVRKLFYQDWWITWWFLTRGTSHPHRGSSTRPILCCRSWIGGRCSWFCFNNDASEAKGVADMKIWAKQHRVLNSFVRNARNKSWHTESKPSLRTSLCWKKELKIFSFKMVMEWWILFFVAGVSHPGSCDYRVCATGGVYTHSAVARTIFFCAHPHIFMRVYVHAWLQVSWKGLLHAHAVDLHLAFSVSCFTRHPCCSCTITSTPLSRPHSLAELCPTQKRGSSALPHEHRGVWRFGQVRSPHRIKIALESYIEEHAQEVWERNWMNLEMQTTLLNTYVPSIANWLREIDSEGASWSWKEEEDSGMMSKEDICQKILCWLRDVKRLIGYIPNVFTRLFQSKSARMQAWNRWIWFGCPQTSLWTQHTRKFDRGFVHENTNKTKKQGKIQRSLPASQLFSAMPPLEVVKVLVSIMMSVSLSKKGKPLKLRHYDISRAHFQGTAQRLIYIRLPSRGSSEEWRRQSWQIGQEHVWNSRRFRHLATWLCDLDLWRIGGLPKRQTQCNIVSQPQRRCEDGSSWWRLCVFVRRWWMDWNTSTVFSNPNTQAKSMGTFGFEESDVKSQLLLSRVFRVGTDQTGQQLDSELDLRHAPLTVEESGCNANTKTVRTTLQDKLVLNGRKSPILKREDATRYRSACMRLEYVAQDRLDFAKKNAKRLAHRMIEVSEFDFIPLKPAARHQVGKPKAALRFWRQENTLTISQSSWTAILQAIWSREKAPRDWWLRSVITPWNLDPHFRAWQPWALKRRSFTQWWKDVKLDFSWDLCAKIWDFQWKLNYKVIVRRRILWRIDWEQDNERNTLTRGTFGYKNESKTETSVSRRCLQRRTAQMLERSQWLLQYYIKHCKLAGLVLHWP